MPRTRKGAKDLSALRGGDSSGWPRGRGVTPGRGRGPSSLRPWPGAARGERRQAARGRWGLMIPPGGESGGVTRADYRVARPSIEAESVAAEMSARMAALMGSGSVGHAATSAARSASAMPPSLLWSLHPALHPGSRLGVISLYGLFCVAACSDCGSGCRGFESRRSPSADRPQELPINLAITFPITSPRTRHWSTRHVVRSVLLKGKLSSHRPSRPWARIKLREAHFRNRNDRG